MQIVPMRDLKNTVAIEKRCAESGEPVFVTKNGYGRLVIMDIALYEATIKKMYEARLVNEALADISAGGQLVDGDELRRKILSRYGN